WGDRPQATFRTGPGAADNWINDWSQNVGAAVINLFDLYVAFWRFAVSMLLERSVQEPRGIVSFITNRSWLRGRAFATMRGWLRDRGVKADVVDLGGDIRAGAGRDDQPIFAILAGSAISTLTFTGADHGPEVLFRRARTGRSSPTTRTAPPTSSSAGTAPRRTSRTRSRRPSSGSASTTSPARASMPTGRICSARCSPSTCSPG